jgi:hypothetical protein
VYAEFELVIVDISDCGAIGDAGFGASDVEHLAADEPDFHSGQMTAESIDDCEDKRKESSFKDSVKDDKSLAADREYTTAAVGSCMCLYDGNC